MTKSQAKFTDCMSVIPKSKTFKVILLILAVLPVPTVVKAADVSKDFLASYEVYKASPTDAAAQLVFLNGFPRTKYSFKALFEPDDFSALYYGSNEYISPLAVLAEKHPSDVENIVLPIVLGGAPNCCDGWASLHKAAMLLYQNNGRMLGNTLKKLTQEQQSLLAHYLTDVENPDYRTRYCKGYISLMKQQRQKELADLFKKVCRSPFLH